MKRFITLVFVVLRLTCLAQSKTTDYILTIDFEPSFISTSKLIIHASQDSSYLQFGINDRKKKSYAFHDEILLKVSDLNQLNNFLKTYQFKIKGSIDTIGSKNGAVEIRMGADGITVNGLLNQNNSVKKFQFWSPQKNSPNKKLVLILFDVMDKAVKDDKSIDYIKRLKEYF